jgi:hypothetical protein
MLEEGISNYSLVNCLNRLASLPVFNFTVACFSAFLPLVFKYGGSSLNSLTFSLSDPKSLFSFSASDCLDSNFEVLFFCRT